jgi:type I restriction enzyme S subunit
MKEGWTYKKLGDVCEILDSQRKPITKGKRESGSIPYYGATGCLDYVKDYIFDEKLVLLGEDGAKWGAGENSAYIINGKSWVNNHAHALRPKRDLLVDELLVYYLNYSNLLSYITGVTVPKLNQEKMRSIEIPIGPVKEQQSIVDYLDSAFAKIDTMKANAEKALNEAKALFQASLKEMLEPKEGWEEKALKDFATDMYRGSGVKRDQVTEEGIPCVRYGEIYINYNYHFNECDSHTLEEYVSSPKYFEYGDILFAITGESVEDIGKSIAYTGKEKCIAGGDMVVMKHKYEPRYISYALSTPSAIKQKGQGKTKLKVVHTNIPSLKEIIIPIAPKDEQIKIADTLDSLKSKIDCLQKNYDNISQECYALKQALLRQVFE